MRRMLGGRFNWVQNSKQRFRQLQNRPLCTNSKQPTTNNGVDKVSNSLSKRDAYKEIENLDFMKAAKILFSDPPKKKKFGLDFHLVQLFFACLPSLAVYLVAQYARHEMRRMEAEMEKKKQAEEEAKAKEMELKAAEEEEAAADPELLEVKVRLEKLEETVKEIVVESKKQSGDPMKKNNVDVSKQEQTASKNPGNHDNRHASEGKAEASHQGKTSANAQDGDASLHSQGDGQSKR